MSENETVIKTLVSDQKEGTKFRQERFSNENSQLKVILNDRVLNAINWSRTGIAFELGDDNLDIRINDIVENVKVLYRENPIYSGKIVIKNISLSSDKKSMGAMFKDNLLPLESIWSIETSHKLQDEITNKISAVHELNPEACRVLVELASFLDLLTDRCDEFERKLSSHTFDSRKLAEDAFMKFTSPIVTDYLVGFNAKISDLVDVDSIPENSSYHRVFHQLIYPYFQDADLAKRAKEKPLGYAGDFEMMNQIYRNGYEGKSLVGKILHNYIANEKSSESVSFRKPYFLNYYKRALEEGAPADQVKILSLASGPCVEYQEAIENFAQDELSRISMTLFDLDRVSLEYAQTKIYEKSIECGKQIEAEFINASVKVFLEHASQTSKGTYDLIYSGGLFDYLDNMTCTAIVTNIFNFLKPGGRLIIGNFTEKNTTKAFCHFVTNWHLIHKSEEQIKEWTKYIPTAEHDVRIEYDNNHINAFLVLERK